MVWFTWIEDGDWGMYYSWEQLDRSTGLVLCPSETVGWPSVAACISWWSLWHGWDWTLDSLVKGPWINLSALIGQQDRTWDLYSSLFGDLDQARVCTKFPGQMRPQVLLCRWGKPWALFSVWMPLYVGPLNGLCWLPPCSGEVLIEQAETCIQLWVGLGFSFSALGTVGEAALKPVKLLFVVLSLTQASALLVRGGQKTLHRSWGCDLAPCLGGGNLGSKVSKTPPLRIQTRQICTPWSPPVRVHPLFASAGGQSC